MALKGGQLQTWLSMSAFAEFLVYWFVYPDENILKKHNELLQSQNRTLHAKSSMMSMITAAEAESGSHQNYSNISNNIKQYTLFLFVYLM